jgi:4-amino-4-deoxy-L-arabinose transferase-like glycosyltransferase
MDKRQSACNHRGVTKRPLPDAVIALLFFVATLVTRIPVLSRSVLDWDESLYFIMAQQWRLGHLPYTTVWDNKPLGIYAIFALFQAIFGDRVFAIRFATIVFISILAFTVFKITQAITQNRPSAWVAGAALLICSLSNDGLSANTELFMATFTALAVLTALTTDLGLLVGLLLGAALMVKYVAVFETPAVFFLFVLRQRRIRATLTPILGAAIPVGVTILLYGAAGRLGLWWHDSIASNFRRVDVPFTAQAMHYAFHTELWRWGPMLLSGLAIFPATLLRRRGPEIFLSAWLLGGAVGVVAAKSFYDHYFLQILPVLCVILGLWFSRLPRHVVLQAAMLVAALGLPAWAAQTALRNTAGPDAPILAAAALNPQHPTSIYVFDTQPIIYALTGTTPPTPYVLPSELIGNTMPHVTGADAGAEVARILAAKPEFILRRSDPSTDPSVINPAIYAQVDAALAVHYELWRHCHGILIFRLKN